MKKIPQHEFEAWAKCKRYPLRTSIADLYLKLHDRIGKWDDADDRAQAVLELIFEEFSDFIVEGEDAAFKGLHADHVSTLEECKKLTAERDALQVKLDANEARYRRSIFEESQKVETYSDREDALRAKFASDPVRAAAIAWVEARKEVGQRHDPSVIRADGKASHDPLFAYERHCLADLLDAVAAERVAPDLTSHEAVTAVREALDRRQAMQRVLDEQLPGYLAPPAPNWRALVAELKRACDAQDSGVRFSDPTQWIFAQDENAAYAVSALIAALDKPEGGETMDDVDLAHQHARVVTKLAQYRAALEATRKELAEGQGNFAKLEHEDREAIVTLCETLQPTVNENVFAAARRVVAERDEALLKAGEMEQERNALIEECDKLKVSFDDVFERALKYQGERDTLKSQLAARSELHEAAVELAEACGAWKPISPSWDRYLAAKQALDGAKGGV